MRRSAGAALPVVLLISAMMLTTSAAWFESSLATARSAANARDYLQAFHAADSALTSCARAVAQGTAPVVPAALVSVGGEPGAWKSQRAFEAASFVPLAQWPGSVRAPQCLAEAWRLKTRPKAQAFLLSARGFGQRQDSQVWLQLQLVIEADKAERHWRRVAARPF